MYGPSESGLLRLAIARGLLTWEDLDSVAVELPTLEDTGGAQEGPWVRALVEAGKLNPETVAALAAELGAAEEEITRTLLGGDSHPGTVGRAGLPLDYAFLADWDRYRIERLLGQGGMGTVFKAFDPTLDRYVALKFLHRNDAGTTARFLREARAQAGISHPHVCAVHEVGEVLGRPFIAMQYVDGRSLGEIGRELPLATRLRIVRDVARAVHAAHKTGLIHRDLKPGNILLATDDGGELHPYVVDFGLAMEQGGSGQSRTGFISGTPGYISPEQVLGKNLDRRTDVYSLGVVLYELLAGSPPFRGENVAQVLLRLVGEEPVPLRKLDPTLPEDLETLVAKCLEKDPARRYDTARDLAEDLDRFLDGEPIHARPSGWFYRAGKRLRKNRALAAMSVAAILAVVALLAVGVASLRAEWRARERAELAQRFGRRIGELEGILTYEAFLPPHDVTPQKHQLRQGMAAIESEMRGIGQIAAGPGHFALGRGYLALHRYEQARAHLEAAWQAGERSPALAVALGRTLAALYERTLAEVSRETSRDEVERRYRLPALAYLKSGGDSPTSPYATALLAFFERRYPEAKTAAREARRQRPAFYEAGELEAEISMAQGNEALNAGRYDEALGFYDEAGELYRDLLRQVPSEAGLYGGDCERGARWVQAAAALRKVPVEKVDAALAACDRALAIDPELVDAVVQKATVYRYRGEQSAGRGEDPRADFATTVDLAGRALASDPDNARTYSLLASTYRLLSRWELGHGLDPATHAQQGIDAARRAVEIQPGLASSYSNLGTAYLQLVLVEQRRGADPRQAVEQAAASYRHALALDPQLFAAQINLGNAWKSMAEVEVARGEDPGASVARAVEAFERSAALNPRNAALFNNLGNAHLTLGEYLLARGSDPRQALSAAVQSYGKAVAVQPDYALARFNLGYTYRSLAEGLLARDEDPGADLAAATDALDAYLRLNATDADAFVEKARVHLIAARWDLRRKKADPSPHFDPADAELRRAAELDAKNPEVYFTQALVARWRAEAIAQGTGSAGSAAVRRLEARTVRSGLERVAAALAVNRSEGRYLALRGLLLARAARLESDAERRREGALQAVAALEAALQANPLLAREYAAALREARALVGLVGRNSDGQAKL